MIQIPRRARDEFPTEAGWYVVHEASKPEPLLLKWTHWSKRWEFPRSVSTVNALGWAGPIKGVKDDFS